jgi:hypothetical protein
MDFLKEMIQLHHHLVLHDICEKLKLSSFEKEAFVAKYNKRNYCMIKICNCKIKENRVPIQILLSKLECDHNPSLSR